MPTLIGVAMLLSLALLACAPSDDAANVGDGLAQAREGTPEAVGMLAFLADAGTTLAVLDDRVPLDRRAATNLIAHRDGPDGQRNTTDDNPFGSIAEVDSVPQVGQSALDAILAYALANGFVPEADDVLGSWDGVTFTVEQSEQVLTFVNGATLAALDEDVPLDARAASGIVAARPFDSIQPLSEVPYVGATALRALQAYAASAEPPPPPPPPPPCEELQFALTVNTPAREFSKLMTLSAGSPYPYAQIRAYNTSGCPGWEHDAVALDAMEHMIYSTAFEHAGLSWGDAGDALRIDDPISGGAGFTALVTGGITSTEAKVAAGTWNPAVSATATDLYARRKAISDALTVPPSTDPAGFADVHLQLQLGEEPGECLWDAHGLVNRTTGALLVIFNHPPC